MAPRFLIDENLSPSLAHHLRAAHGFDAVHVRELGLRGASDPDVLARAVAEERIVMTGNAEDFRELGGRTPAHPGLAVMLDAVGRARQLALGVCLANAIDAAGSARGRLFAIDRMGIVREYKLPDPWRLVAIVDWMNSAAISQAYFAALRHGIASSAPPLRNDEVERHRQRPLV